MSCPQQQINRRKFLTRVAASISALALPVQGATPTEGFSHQVVLTQAMELASQPFQSPALVPEALLNLNYDQYRSIQFQKQAAIWGSTRTPFSIELFAPGSFYTSGIDIALVENGQARNVSVEPDTFLTPNADIENLLAELDKVSGFRLHYPLNNPAYQDEFVVFQGASYFRTVSSGQNYGLSARGLAIDVAEPSGEEFPVFRKFWIERPSPDSDNIVVHALLDSERVTGAYRFGIYPGSPTRMDIEATLFARTTVNHLGLGALTSMFFFGGMDRADVPDYRNAVHDSDGLAILNGNNEYLWRPLNNPSSLQISAFVDNNPRGFGLIQRNRKFEDYQDLQARYHTRPSTWITPRGNWGPGQVVLVEIPTDSETNDNIVAYWRPQTPLVPGEPFHFAYQLSSPDDVRLPRDFARIKRSASGLKLTTAFPQLVIDYADLPEGTDLQALTFETTVSRGKVLETQVAANGPTGARLFFTFDPDGAQQSEIRIQPKLHGVNIGETLLHRWLAR